MDVVGSEIGQKMRSAIKAKLTELGCYVDDELPDYVMVMVANKRTRAQMEDDLQLFLGENTELFVNWLHQVLKKLQEVTVTAPLKTTDPEKSKEKTKEKKSKVKKDKDKLKKVDGSKKAKKKDKEKSHKKKEEKKTHKSKKKSKHHEMIRPNIPPLLMNMEKESEPSITDVFAGQILKNHGISVDILKEEKEKPVDKKPEVKELKRPIIPIIDPATISTQPEPMDVEAVTIQEPTAPVANTPTTTTVAPREEQIKEITEIEAKIQGLKQKLAEQIDSMSDDEDFLNIRTEAEELMNDFAEDVFQEISSQAPISTPPLTSKGPPTPPAPIPKPPEPKEPPKEIETLPQIELQLPKRPVRDRLGAREAKKVPEAKKVLEGKEKQVDKRTESPERFTPEREPDFWPKSKSARSRLGEPPEAPKRSSMSDESSDKSDSGPKRLTSKVSSLESRPRVSCASVVRVRPRPRVATPASSLLLRAVADAHKSLLNIPPKVDPEPQKVKRALVLPMRRCVDTQNIVIQVQGEDRHMRDVTTDFDSDNDDKSSKVASDIDKEEYIPSSLTKKIQNTDYVPSRRLERTSSRKDDTLIIETINIHNTTVDKDKDTQFIVTMDGFNPNAFLAKKLMTEGLLNDEEEIKNKPANTKTVLKTTEAVLKPVESAVKTTESVLKTTETVQKTSEPELKAIGVSQKTIESVPKTAEKEYVTEEEVESERESGATSTNNVQKKRLSNTSDESDTQVIIRSEENTGEKRNSIEDPKEDSPDKEDSPPVKKRKASPIVFDAVKKEKEVEKERQRERTDSVSSDNHVIVTTTVNSHKYDSLPSLSQAERKLVWCRAFPLCRYGSACAFQHPRCKFAAACTRRNCVYSHGPARVVPVTPPPVVASHVVPVANFKTITPGVAPTVCKYYPNCANPACHYYHPKPCRYGKACANKLECNFYHSDTPSAKWRYPV